MGRPESGTLRALYQTRWFITEGNVNEVILVLSIMLGVVAVCAVAIKSAVESPTPFRTREIIPAHGAQAEELRRGRL